MITPRRIFISATIGVAHAMFTTGLLLTTGGRIMAAFEGERASSWIDSAGLVVVAVLMMPLTPLGLFVPAAWERALPGLGNAFFLLNSALWGIAIPWLVRQRAARSGV